jgi:hypothetical protein
VAKLIDGVVFTKPTKAHMNQLQMMVSYSQLANKTYNEMEAMFPWLKGLCPPKGPGTDQFHEYLTGGLQEGPMIDAWKGIVAEVPEFAWINEVKSCTFAESAVTGFFANAKNVAKLVY